jgi:hypothetical protein
MGQYRILRTWAVVLPVLGVVSFLSTALGLIWLAFAAHGVWETAAVIAIGVPVAVLMATWPLALGQALRAIADIGDDMAFESLTTRASSTF